MRTRLASVSFTLLLQTAALSPLDAQQVTVTRGGAEKQRVEGVVESIGYAQAIQVGNTIYVSGAVSPGAAMEEQVTGVYRSLARTLARFGATLNDVVKETAYTTDMEALKAANPARRTAYGMHSPAATWVQISRLYMETAKVEIEVTAVVGSGK